MSCHWKCRKNQTAANATFACYLFAVKNISWCQNGGNNKDRVRKKNIEEDNHLVSATVNCHPFPFNSFMSVRQVKLLIRGGLIKIWCSNFLFFCVKKHFNNSERVDGKKNTREFFMQNRTSETSKLREREKNSRKEGLCIRIIFWEMCLPNSKRYICLSNEPTSCKNKV